MAGCGIPICPNRMPGDLNLHRITAKYVPTNERSAALQRRLEFVREGNACDSLLIAGSRQGHVLTAFTHRDWQKPTGELR